MKRARKPKRHEYHVTYDAAKRVWVCRVNGAVTWHWGVKDELVASVGDILAGYEKTFGQHSELIVHRKDGTIGKGPSSRRSYGGDPKGTKG